MSKLKGKLARRIMAIVLSGAMVMSNMSAYAAELSTEKETEIVSQVESPGATETTAGTAGEEPVSGENDENAEAEDSDAGSSEDITGKVTAKETTTEDVTAETETDTDTVESTVDETRTESVEDEETTVTEAENEASETISENVSYTLDDNNVLDVGKMMKDNNIDVTNTYTGGTITAGMYTIAANKLQFVTANVSYDENLSFTGAFKTGGNGSTSLRYIQFSANEGDTVVAYAITGSSEDRALMLDSAAGMAEPISVDLKYNSSGSSTGADASNKYIIGKLEYEVEESGNYYIYSPTSSTIYYIEVVKKEAAPTEGPAAPTNLTAEVGAIADGVAESVELTWDAAEDVDSYRVLVCDEELTDDTADSSKLFNKTIVEANEDADEDEDADDGFIYDEEEGTVSYTVTLDEDSDFEQGETYYFYVYSVDGDEESERYASCSKKIVSGTEATYELNPATLAPDYDNSQSDQKLADGMLLGDNVYFKTMVGYYETTDSSSGETVKKDGSLTLQYKSSKYILLTSQMESSGVTFTVEGTADAVFEVASTSGDNNSVFGLMNSSDELVAGTVTGSDVSYYQYGDEENAYSVKGTSICTITYTDLPAGTYTFLSPEVSDPGNGENGRGGRIHSISVTETSNRDARGDWSDVADPTIKSVTWHQAGDSDIEDYEVNSVTVVATGIVGYDGGDKLELTVTEKDADEAAYTAVSRVETTNQNNETTFTIPAKTLSNGSYDISVALSRSGESNVLTGSYSGTLDYVVALAAPDSLAAVRDDSVTSSVVAKVSWNVVADAASYKIAVYDITGAADLADDAVPTGTPVYTKDNITAETDATTVTLSVDSGLEEGKAYRFCVYSVAEDETSDAAVKDLEIATTVVGTYVFEASSLVPFTAPTENEERKAGTNNYFTLACGSSNKIVTANTTSNDALVFDDDYAPTAGLQFGGSYATTKNHIKFTTTGSASIKIWWALGTANRTVALYDASGKTELSTGATGDKVATPYMSTFEVSEGGTYIIGSSTAIGAKGDIRIYKVEVTEGVSVNVTKTFDGASIYTAEQATGTWTDGQAVSYVDGYFTVLYSGAAKVEKKSYSGSQAWSDEYTGGYRLNFGGVATKDMNSIKFTTTESEATVKVWWKAGADGRHVQILDESGTPLEVSTEESAKDVAYITKFKLTSAGTYYLGNAGGNNYLFKVSVTEGHVEDPVPWDTVEAPVIKSAVQDKDKNDALTGSITVTVAAYIDELKGCEKVTVEMYNEDPAANPEAEIIETVSSAKTTTSAESTVTVTFSPEESGNYYFIARASRAEERTTIDSDVFAMADRFILPLTAPSITRATNDGKGGIEIAYSEVDEADKYIASAVQVTKNEDGTYTPVEGAEPITTERVITEEDTATTATLTGLKTGEYYAFTVYAVRGEEEGPVSDEFYKIVKSTAEQVWDYSSYGVSTSTSESTFSIYDKTTGGTKLVKMAQDGYSGDVNDGELSVWSLNGKGKIVPGSSEDGLSFVYTKIDKDTNFELTATAVVDSWTYSNGQEGFGLMVSDSVGKHGEATTFWNNSYMAVATKIEYYWNGSTILPATVGVGDDRVRYNMYLGIGSLVRTGVTDEWAAESAAGATIPSKFLSQSLSLEHTAGSKGLESGSYNIIGSATSSGGIDVAPLLTEIRLKIEKNNTGYFISYIDADGEVTTNKYYEGRAIVDQDYANQSLLQIDKDYMYVGFFAARNAMVTFKDIEFTTSPVDPNEEPEEKPATYNEPSYKILSANLTNSPSYDIEFTSNWKGTLSVKDSAGVELLTEEYFDYLEKTNTTVLGTLGYEETTLLDKFFTYETEIVLDEDGNEVTRRKFGTEELKPDVKAVIPINDEINSGSLLSIGANRFTVTFTPDRTWHIDDDELQLLSSYDTSVQTLTVNYRAYGEEGTNIYAAPDGKATNDGSQDSPLDIYTAVKYVQPGQTIVLKAGTYSLKTPLNIERGIDGTAEKPIRMIADPETYKGRSNPFEQSSVILDFNTIASGMTIAGDYWYLRGFDVTRSSDGDKGLQISGSHNVLDQINTYKNGNTGIQLSRYKSTDLDKSDDWPSYNTILNCTSYLNADSGYEDADGFAAKLTIGDGNVFDGCIAAYNADDGWDLYAKAESGPIGQVIIQNCVAFKNGYVLRIGGTDSGALDLYNGKEVDAGNGNGFKMGGESISGYHLLLNSYSFDNKANGIESNSCPDIQVYNSISFNNEAYNVAFYTKTATQTDYRAANVISFRTKNTDVKEELSPTGTTGEKDGWNYNDYKGSSNFYWNLDKGVSENANGKTVAKEWFKSVEFGGIDSITRSEEGTINMGGFLALSDAADTSAFVKLERSENPSGAVIYKAADGEADLPGLGGTPSQDGNKAEADTSGSVDSNDDEDTVSSDVWTDDELKQLDLSDKTLKILLNFGYDSDTKAFYDSEGRYFTDYTGTAIKPSVRVAYGTTELSTKNYSVSFKNNTKAYEYKPGDAGFDEKYAPTVVVKGKGNYAGEYKLYFTINRIDIGTNNKVAAADLYTVYNNKDQKLAPAVTFNGKKLGTKDYTVSKAYQEVSVTDDEGNVTGTERKEIAYTGKYKEAGTYYVELTGQSKDFEGTNFKGTKTVMIKVLSESEAASLKPMSKVKVDKIIDQVYDGTAHKPAVSVTYNGSALKPLTVDEEGNVQGDYDIAYYNNTDIGIGSVILTGNIDQGYYGTKTVTFKTVAKSFNLKDYNVTIRYNGKDYKTNDVITIEAPGSAVTFGNIVVSVDSTGTRLTEDIDYTVSYKGNNKAGNASVVIKGMGNYKGSMTRKFTITPLIISESNTNVSVAKEVTYTKGGAKPTVIVKVDTNNDGNYNKVISSANYSVSYKNNTKIGEAYVSITGKNLLKGNVKNIPFNITAKDIRLADITAPNVYYGTAKSKGDQTAYLTKLVAKDGTKTLSLNSDYTVTYYEEVKDATPIFDYKEGKLTFIKTVEVENEDGTSTVEQQQVDPVKLEKNSKIDYNPTTNQTIYAVITGGKNGFYTGYTYATYKVVGTNDIKYAKITKIKTPEVYNDSTVSAPKLEVKIQNRHLDSGSGKYVKDTELTTLTLNEHYEIVGIKNNDRAGTATITIQGIGYYAGTNKVTFKIDKKDLTAWDAYIANAVVSNITVEVDEADVQEGGKYENGITFDDVTIKTGEIDEDGNEIVKTEKSVLATAAKIFMIGTSTSTTLTYGTDYTASSYSNNVVNVSSLEFDEDGYAEQTASVTIIAAGSYTGSKTFTFTIRIKKTPEPETV